jgi:hypothetical protein
MAIEIDREVGEGHYMMLTDADLLLTYRDQLRGKETEHARKAATPETYSSSPDRYEIVMEGLETEIIRLREKVVTYEEKVEAELAAAQAEAEADAPVEADPTEEIA